VKATISRRQSRLREVVGRNVPMSSRLWIWGSVVSSPPVTSGTESQLKSSFLVIIIIIIIIIVRSDILQFMLQNVVIRPRRCQPIPFHVGLRRPLLVSLRNISVEFTAR